MLAAGCASREYVPPTGKSFDLEFVNQRPDVRVTLTVFEDDYDCYGSRFVTPLFAEVTTKAIKASPRRHYTVMYGYNQNGGLLTGAALPCGGAATFDVEDAPYRVTIGYDNAKEKCIFDITKRTTSGWIAAKNVTQREARRPFLDNTGPWCAANEAFRGSSDLPTPR